MKQGEYLSGIWVAVINIDNWKLLIIEAKAREGVILKCFLEYENAVFFQCIPPCFEGFIRILPRALGDKINI